jgi:hypothetical protein
MIRKLFAFAAILAALAVLQAQPAKTVTIEGYIIDNACADGHKSEATFGATVKKHPKSCALMDGCVTSGYAVLTSDAKLYKLDKAGNDSTEAILRATTTKSGLAVVIEGTIEGDVIKVTKITQKTAE